MDVARFRRQIFLIAEEQSWRCHWCGWRLTELTVTRDHLIPRSRGGSNRRDNIVASCAGCNGAKGDMDSPPDGYLEKKRAAVALGLDTQFRHVRPFEAVDATRKERLAKKKTRRRKVRMWQIGFDPTIADIWPQEINRA